MSDRRGEPIAKQALRIVLGVLALPLAGAAFVYATGRGCAAMCVAPCAVLGAIIIAMFALDAPQFQASFSRRDGRCVRCSYDLRASPDRCPECGTPVAQ